MRNTRLHTTLLLAAAAATMAFPAVAPGQQSIDPVVAKSQMRFAVGEEVIDQIDRGDLLTVLEDRDTELLVLTFRGKRGLVSKSAVVSLAGAVYIYDELIKKQPEESRLYTLRASAWWARGDEQKALADYDKAIELGLETTHAYVSRGLFHASLGNYDEAVADYTKAIGLDPTDASMLTNRAAVYMSQQKYQLAADDYTAAIKLQPQRASHYEQRALAWKVLGDFEQALADYRKATELNPQFVAAYMGCGFLHFRRGQHAKAVEDFSRAIEHAPDLAQAYNNRGYNRQMLGQFADALADYEEAIKLNPDYALAYQNKAWLLAASSDDALRNGKQAIAAATTACDLTGYEHLGAVKALAAAFAEDGQFAKAVGWQEKVVEAVSEEYRESEREVLERYQAGKVFRLEENE